MAIPRKRSRPVVVNGVTYRWYVRHRPSHGQAMAASNLSFAVQHAQAPGTTLLVELPFKHPGNLLGEEAAVVLPSTVALHIEAALAQGWKPTHQGKAFHMSALKMQDGAVMVTPPALIL